MKKFVLVVSIICVAALGYSQRWQHVFGYPNTNESFRKIEQLYDKGYMISASYEENRGNW